MNHDKAALGTRYTCYQCGTKFYDLNRPEPTCPECGADQREAPALDIKSLLQGGRRATLSDSDMTSSIGSSDSDELGLDSDDESYDDDDDSDDSDDD